MQNTSREKILILVKTYPTPSTKYVETVCTAGIRADGSWVRIFPVPFRSYKEYQRYMKYQWVECSIYKSDKDKRPESFHIDQTYPLELGDHIGTEEAWEKRRRLVLDKVQIFTRQSELLEASRTNAASLAVFKPTALKLHWSTAEIEEADPHRLASIKAQLAQRDFFEENYWRPDFKLAEPIPYDFKYEITDADGKTFTHKIIDWELGALFLNQKRAKGVEGAKQDVMTKYGVDFLAPGTDIYLFMGTMYKFQKMNVANPWTIIGVAPFPRVAARQPDLF